MDKIYSILQVGDLHVNHRAGLHVPVLNVTDKIQRRMFAHWESLIEKYRSVTTDIQGNSNIIVERIAMFNGDIIDLDTKRRSHEYIWSNPVDARAACIDVIAPVMGYVDHAFFVYGTPSHVGKSGREEEAVARDWDNTVWYEKDKRAAWWHLRAEFGEVRFDVKHHFTMGRLPWTEKNAANKMAAIIQWHCWDQGTKLPHVAIRSHNHRISDSGRNFKVKAICAGAFQSRTEYAHRGEWGEADIQGNIFICQKGDYTWLPQDYEIPTVTTRIPYPTLDKLTR